MLVSIIIVSYNVKYFLEQCLCSVSRAIDKLDAEVWVVDNASSDGSIEYLASKFSWANFISNSKNVGYAKANNQAVAGCCGKYILYLNPDTIIPEDSILKTIAFIEQNKQAGAVGVRMIDGTGAFLPESKRAFPSLLTSFYKLSGICKIFPSSKVFSKYSLPHLNEFENHEVDVLAGAFMLVKHGLVKQLKGFDEAFFMYGEDIDLSYRIQKLGYKNYYFSQSTIIHFKGESSPKDGVKHVENFYAAMSIFVKKHQPHVSARPFILLIIAAIWLRAVISAMLVIIPKRVLFNFEIREDKNQLKRQQRTIVAGTVEEYDKVKNLLERAGLVERKMEQLEITCTGEGPEREMKHLTALRGANEFKQIIFCHGYLSYSQIIQLVQTLFKSNSIRFSGSGTESVVGSDSKNTPGECIGADNPSLKNRRRSPAGI